MDAAEDEENRGRVYAVNVDGTANIASVCSALDCKLLYISTDYVFDGQGDEPWRPDCRTYAPLNVYGRSKLEGELAVASAVERISSGPCWSLEGHMIHCASLTTR